MTEPRIRLVVFDIAGTTVKDENYVHQTLINSMQKYGYTVSIEEANAVMGYPKPYAIRELLKIKEEDSNKINDGFVTKIHEAFVAEMIAFYKSDPNVVPINNAEETFILLKKLNIKVALDTGFSKEITDVIINRLNWKENGLIDASISSDEVEDGRPYPYMIHTLMSMLNIRNSDAVAKVGDTISDLQEGNNAACKYVIGITTGAFTKQQLKKHPHTHLVDNLLEVINIVTQ